MIDAESYRLELEAELQHLTEKQAIFFTEYKAERIARLKDRLAQMGRKEASSDSDRN